jgi:hypothetical protein
VGKGEGKGKENGKGQVKLEDKEETSKGLELVACNIDDAGEVI